MAYLYRHIRLDKNEPFYIGIGSDSNYKRAYSVHNRNRHWKNIVAKTNYEVEIVLDELSWEQAANKEKEFIALYKRKLDGGCLCNLTLGGEGVLGFKPPKELVERLTAKKIGRKQSPEHIEKRSAKMRGSGNHFFGKKLSAEHRRKLS